MSNKDHEHSFTLEVLDFFLSIPEGVCLSFSRKEFYRILYDMPTERILTVSNICGLFNQFKQSGYIEIKSNKNKGQSVRFTNKSRLALVDKYAERAKKNKSPLFCFVRYS